MLKPIATSWSKIIDPGMHLLRVMCAVFAILLVSFDPSLFSLASAQNADFAALEKSSDTKSEAVLTGQLSMLPLVVGYELGTLRLLIHEQNTSFVSSLTPRDHTSTGSARAPPFSA